MSTAAVLWTALYILDPSCPCITFRGVIYELSVCTLGTNLGYSPNLDGVGGINDPSVVSYSNILIMSPFCVVFVITQNPSLLNV